MFPNMINRYDIMSMSLCLDLIVSTRVLDEHSLPSFIFSLDCSRPDQTSCAIITNRTTHPLYMAGSLAFSHFFQWRPMGLCGLGDEDLAIAPTAALHCSTPTGMTQRFNLFTFIDSRSQLQILDYELMFTDSVEIPAVRF